MNSIVFCGIQLLITADHAGVIAVANAVLFVHGKCTRMAMSDQWPGLIRLVAILRGDSG
jgi:hypothetical protein